MTGDTHTLALLRKRDKRGLCQYSLPLIASENATKELSAISADASSIKQKSTKAVKIQLHHLARSDSPQLPVDKFATMVPTK